MTVAEAVTNLMFARVTALEVCFRVYCSFVSFFESRNANTIIVVVVWSIYVGILRTFPEKNSITLSVGKSEFGRSVHLTSLGSSSALLSLYLNA